MQTQFFQYTGLHPMVKPMQDLMELNVKTIQRFSYITPVELLNMRRPEDILQKNMNMMIKNTQTAMDYMQDVFHLLEKNLLSSTQSIMDHQKDSMQSMQKAAQTTSSNAVKTAKKAISKVKKSVSSRSSSKVKMPGSASTVKKASSDRNVSKQPVSALKEVTKNMIKESESKKGNPTVAKSMIQLGTDNKKDTLK
jgi:uncharacterized protein YbjQ (UPF0145 family)